MSFLTFQLFSDDWEQQMASLTIKDGEAPQQPQQQQPTPQQVHAAPVMNFAEQYNNGRRGHAGI